jgi:hypothetical protein
MRKKQKAFVRSSRTAAQANVHPRNPWRPDLEEILIFFETLRIFFLCRGKQMIAPLQMGGRHWVRTRALATVDPRVGDCSHLTQFININNPNGDQL